MPKPTTLAAGQINNSDRITVELHRPADLPAFVLITWPATVTSPDQFAAVIAATFQILANARIVLAGMRGNRRTQ